MRRKFGIQLQVLLVLTLFIQTGCLSRKRAIPEDQRMLPAMTATRTELFNELQDRAEEVKTMSAAVTLDVASGAAKTGVLTEYRQTKGFIIVERPGNIRVRAQAPLALATVFDMVSDGRQFRMSIPLKNKFYVGDNHVSAKADNPVLNLRPQVIMEALFVDVREHLDDPLVKWTLEESAVGRTSYYVVQFIDISKADAELVEKLWVDRTNMQITRKQVFGRDGKLDMDVEYSDYQLFGEISFPQVISIKRIEDYSLKITFQRNTINQQLAADAFRLEQPAGAELVQLEPEAMVRPF